MEGLKMDLRVIDLQYRLEHTQKHLKNNRYLSLLYKDDIKEIDKILAEIGLMVKQQLHRSWLM
jgi:membrane-associated PAP2 superfamily phosphatase